MPIYTAYFHTDAECATYKLQADTPEQALALARQLYDDDPLELMFQSYDDNLPMNEIEISDPDGSCLALWRDDDRPALPRMTSFRPSSWQLSRSMRSPDFQCRAF